MNKQLLKDTLGWGFLLWLIGYILGIILFMFVSSSILGWIIMPVGIIITLWVLLKKIKSNSFQYYLHYALTFALPLMVGLLRQSDSEARWKKTKLDSFDNLN